MTTAFRPSAPRRYEMSVSPAVSDRENALPGKVSDDEVMLWYQNVVKPVARAVGAHVPA
jgi:hypothetical protein